MATSSANTSAHGFTTVNDPQRTVADVVFVPGLLGDPKDTWSNKVTGVFWPGDLATKLPQLRILFWRYKANVKEFFSMETKGDSYAKHAYDLLQDVLELRGRNSPRPLIFVAHSVGGIIVERALFKSNPLRKATTEVLFFGTPHREKEWKKFATNVAEAASKDCHPPVPRETPKLSKSDGKELENLGIWFEKLVSGLVPDKVEGLYWYSFYETAPTPYAKYDGLIVKKNSPSVQSVIQIPIAADHFNICRFDSLENYHYNYIVSILKYQEDLANVKALTDGE